MSGLRIAILLFVSVLVSCTANTSQMYVGESFSDELTDSLYDYFAKGHYDSIINKCNRIYRLSELSSDTLAMIRSKAVSAEAYLFKGQLDVVQSILDSIDVNFGMISNPEAGIVISNVKGILSLKKGLDYHDALKYYLEGLKFSEQIGNIENRITFLTNIVNIFYLMEDRHGSEYAEKAYELSEYTEDRFSVCIAEIAMAQMLILQEDYAKASWHIDNAKTAAYSNAYWSLVSRICMLQADICLDKGNPGAAGACYDEALTFVGHTLPSIATQLYLRYGVYQEKQENYEQALDSYQKALMNSYQFNDQEYRYELLRKISGIYAKTNNFEASLVNYQAYQNVIDSISLERNKQEFHNLILEYQEQKYELEIRLEKLALANQRQKTAIVLTISLMLMILLVSGSIMYFRQRKTYKLLVVQHQSYLKRISSNEIVNEKKIEAAITKPTESLDKDFELYAQIEEMMKTGKVFKENGISVDKLAEYLNSNRYYVSRAINRYSGLSFHNYINMYRINEAINIIQESSEDEILFKQLAYDLGYNSLSVFSKVFVKETGVTPSRYKKELGS